MNRQRLLLLARPAAGAAVVAVLVWRLGAQPFVDGIRRLDATSVAAALGLTVLTTLAAAWRWRVVAESLGLRLPMSHAVRDCYRSQLVNVTLPGGVVGDVERGLRNGADGRTAVALRSVVWERAGGQAVQFTLTVAVLVALPLRALVAPPTLVVLGAAVVGAIGLGLWAAHTSSARFRLVRMVMADVRVTLLSRRTLPKVLVASTLVVAGHTTVFLVAARATGAPLSTLLPVALVVLAASAIPANVGGWGPREGAAAAAFASAGLGADAGIATSAAYGVLTLVAALPAAALLVADRTRRRPRPSHG